MAQVQHYISKVLTKEWELPSPGRKLRFYDFAQGKLLIEEAGHLLATENLWPEKLEIIFDKKFEKRIIEDIKKLMASPEAEKAHLSWESFRSIILMHLFNCMRSMKARLNLKDIESFASLNSSELDSAVDAFAKDIDFFRIPLKPNLQFFFPEIGFFAIPLAMYGTTKMNFGFAIPVHPQISLGMFPKGFDRKAFFEVCEYSSTFFVQLSVGMPSSQRVIIHPKFSEGLTDEQLIDSILSARNTNTKAAQLVQNSSEDLQSRISSAVKAMKPFSPKN